MSVEEGWQRAVRCVLRRVAAWRTPPNWSHSDWIEEMRAEAEAGGWRAYSEHVVDSTFTLFQFAYHHALNACLQRYRQEWRYALRCCPIEEWWPSRQEDRLDISMALACLPQRDRALLYALFWEGRSETDLARERGISVQAVSQHKRRVLRKLRKILG